MTTSTVIQITGNSDLTAVPWLTELRQLRIVDEQTQH
jgi:hypothetical protein